MFLFPVKVIVKGGSFGVTRKHGAIRYQQLDLVYNSHLLAFEAIIFFLASFCAMS